MDIRLVIEKGSNKPKTIRLRSAETIIGRGKGCDVRIPSAAVSRRHCRLSFRDDVLEVEDLESANGVFVNDVMVEGAQILRPGDRLEIGPIIFLVKYQLTPAAINRLLKEDPNASQVMEVDVEEMVEDAPETEVDEIEVEEEAPQAKKKAPPGKGKKTADKKDLKKTSPSAGAKKAEPVKNKPGAKKEPPPTEETANPGMASLFDEGSNWHIPTTEDIRDIFSDLEDS